MESLFTDEYFMRKALDEAAAALEEDEIPIGAVVVHNQKIIGKGHNQTERLKDVTAHAEMVAITAASSYLDSKFLEECTLYVTVEPCCMCAGAVKWARLGRVVYGASEPKFGYQTVSPAIVGVKTKMEGGLLAEECALLMKAFFASKR
jgi:tRNA(adenine34) deaminase